MDKQVFIIRSLFSVILCSFCTVYVCYCVISLSIASFVNCHGVSSIVCESVTYFSINTEYRIKPAVLMYRSLRGTAPLYLVNNCTPTADVSGRQQLRSASQRKLIVPRYRLNSFGRRCFAVAGPSTWNSLPDRLHDPALSLNVCRRQQKTYFFRNIDEMYSAH